MKVFENFILLFLSLSTSLVAAKKVEWNKGSYQIKQKNFTLTKKEKSHEILVKHKKISLEYETSLPSPIIEGEKIHAVDVTLEIGRRRLVSAYHTRGEKKQGVIQLIKLSVRHEPVVTSEIIFKYGDINAIYLYHSKVYFAGSDPNGSFFSYVEIDDDKFENMAPKIYLPGYVATDIVTRHHKIYVTTGDNGGIFAFNEGDVSANWSYKIHDARSVDLGKSGREINVLSGQPGKIYRFDRDGKLLKNLEISGAQIPESKSTIISHGYYSFATVGEDGLKVLCKDKIVAEIPSIKMPDIPEFETVTNSVALYKDLILTANGVAGVYAYHAKNFLSDRYGRCKGLKIKKAEHVHFKLGISANHIAAGVAHIFVASGVDGVRIYRIRTKTLERDKTS